MAQILLQGSDQIGVSLVGPTGLGKIQTLRVGVGVPLLARREEHNPQVDKWSHFFIPFWQSWKRDSGEDGISRYRKLWPLFQMERGEDRRVMAFPALNPLWRTPVLDAHYAWIYEDIPRLALQPDFSVELDYNRLHMIGAGANYAWGAWLLKAEAAGFEGFRYFNDPGQEHWRVDAMAGVEYYGFNDHTLALEIVNRHVLDYQNVLEQGPDFVRENNVEYALRWTGDWLSSPRMCSCGGTSLTPFTGAATLSGPPGPGRRSSTWRARSSTSTRAPRTTWSPSPRRTSSSTIPTVAAGISTSWRTSRSCGCTTCTRQVAPTLHARAASPITLSITEGALRTRTDGLG